MADFEPRIFRILRITILVVALTFLVVSLIGAATSGGYWWIAFIVSILGTMLGVAFFGVTHLLMAIEEHTYSFEESLNRVIKNQDQLVSGIQLLNENMLLSDDAKAIAFRKNDIQALRQAIEEEISRKDWEAALYLADQMERRFGYLQEARQFRGQVNQFKDNDRREALSGAMEKFKQRLTELDWEEAAKEIDSIRKAFPDSPEIADLEDQLENAKTARKKWLLQQWSDAVQRNEIDRGIEILKALDKYLTKNEVAAFEESARGVFRAKLNNLGVQFSLLVAEKIWDKALAVGEEIIKEFPNSRMAQEIKESISTLRSKAEAMKENK